MKGFEGFKISERKKIFVGYLQFMVGLKHTLAGYLIFPVGQNVRYAFRFVGQFSNLVGHCPMSDRYFKACVCKEPLRIYNST